MRYFYILLCGISCVVSTRARWSRTATPKEPCPGRPRDEHETATAANQSLISAGAHTHRENYTMYKYVLNLPGSTSGSYALVWKSTSVS